MSENLLKQRLEQAGWIDSEKASEGCILFMRGIERVLYECKSDSIIYEYEAQHLEDFQIQKLIDRLRDGERLDADAIRTLEHVRGCEVCTKNVEEIVETIGFVRKVFDLYPDFLK